MSCCQRRAALPDDRDGSDRCPRPRTTSRLRSAACWRTSRWFWSCSKQGRPPALCTWVFAGVSSYRGGGSSTPMSSTGCVTPFQDSPGGQCAWYLGRRWVRRHGRGSGRRFPPGSSGGWQKSSKPERRWARDLFSTESVAWVWRSSAPSSAGLIIVLSMPASKRFCDASWMAFTLKLLRGFRSTGFASELPEPQCLVVAALLRASSDLASIDRCVSLSLLWPRTATTLCSTTLCGLGQRKAPLSRLRRCECGR